MAGVFVNYRRGEHTATVEALYDRLAAHFGRPRVFLDRPAIDLGERYPDALRREVCRADVLLVVVHAEWLTARDDAGERLIDRPGDWVRQEIEIALDHHRVIVPVLLGAAAPPTTDELPGSIRDLAYRQAHRLRAEGFGSDVTALIRRLEPHVAPSWEPPVQPLPPRPRRPTRVGVAVSATLSAALLLGLPLLDRLDPATGSRAEADAAAILLSFALLSVLMMGAPALAHLVVQPLRGRFIVADRNVQSWAADRYRRFTVPLLLSIIGFGTLIQVVTTDRWRVATPLVLGFGLVMFAWANYVLTSEVQREEDTEAGWPGPLPSPLTDWGRFRRALALFRRRERGWPGPLTRDQRDRARWFVDRVADAVGPLRERIALGRWRYLLTEHRWAVYTYPLWLAFTLGLLLTALPYLRTDRQWGIVTGTLAGMLVFTLGHLEAQYRWTRWHRERLLEEVLEHLRAVAERLYLGTLDDVPWQRIDGGAGIPLLLRTVATGDEDRQRAATEELAELLDGEAGRAATPFLADLATARHLAPDVRRSLTVLADPAAARSTMDE